MQSQPLARVSDPAQHGRMLTGPQIRAARALLGWSARDLAERAKVSYQTVQRGENAPGIPVMRTPNLFAIQRALEDGGIVVLEEDANGGVGVRFRKGSGPSL